MSAYTTVSGSTAVPLTGFGAAPAASDSLQSDNGGFESVRPQVWPAQLMELASHSHAANPQVAGGDAGGVQMQFAGSGHSQLPNTTPQAAPFLSFVPQQQAQDFFAQSAAHHAQQAAGMRSILDGAVDGNASADVLAAAFAVNQLGSTAQDAAPTTSDPVMFSNGLNPHLEYFDFLRTNHHQPSFQASLLAQQSQQQQEQQQQTTAATISSSEMPNPPQVADHTQQPHEPAKPQKKAAKPTTSITAKSTARPRRRWTPAEVSALEAGMFQYGTNWAGLLSDARIGPALAGRTQMQCKDKAAVEKERRVKRALREGRVVGVHELGVWRYACDRKRAFANVAPPAMTAAAGGGGIGAVIEDRSANTVTFPAMAAGYNGVASSSGAVLGVPSSYLDLSKNELG
ncbi:hypothetical protein HDU83_006509 [Entophlyctis luteolus]|nr:hypothetical protein HDU83_006509 [Entophlyctis luteolus]